MVYGTSAWTTVPRPPAAFRARTAGHPTPPGGLGVIRVVNSTGSVVTRRGTGTDRDWLCTEGEQSHDADVFGFCGGAARLRSAALDQVGGVERQPVLYCER